jgi:hypothetical protein
VGEVGRPDFVGWPLPGLLGARQCVVGMVGSIWRGVELVQRVDDEAAVAHHKLAPHLEFAGLGIWRWSAGCAGSRGWACAGTARRRCTVRWERSAGGLRIMVPGGGGRRERALVSGLAAAARISCSAGRCGPVRRRVAWRGRVPR